MFVLPSSNESPSTLPSTDRINHTGTPPGCGTYFLYKSSPPGFSTTSTLTNTKCFTRVFATSGRAWYLSRYLHQPQDGEPNDRNTALLCFWAWVSPSLSKVRAGGPLIFGVSLSCGSPP